MKHNDIIPDHFIYQALIMAYGKHKNYQKVLDVFQEMEEENVAFSK